MTAYPIVRAEVAEADRAAFDHWCETERLPDALAARHGWSDATPGVHFAICEFPELARAREINRSETIKTLVTEFDRVWRDRVRRSREIVGITQTL